jgi:two-component system chemotaxis response regulator CheB
MVSSLTEKGALATFEALALGAVDFIPKPGGTISLHVDDIKAMLLDKVRSASRAKMGAQNGGRKTLAARPLAKPAAAPAQLRAAAAPRTASAPLARASLPGLVLIGVSTGGPRTLEEILPRLPANFPWPVLVAQHMPANFTETFARRLDGLCALKVVEVATPMPLLPGHAYIGRGATDITVTDRAGVLYAAPRPETPAVLWHPSVGVMVDSAMKHLPPNRLVGVMLTGMGNDGAEAMTRLHAAGGRTIAESAETAVVFGMPHELIELGGASLVLPCNNIALQLRHWML